jgi:hypothetical protein
MKTQLQASRPSEPGSLQPQKRLRERSRLGGRGRCLQQREAYWQNDSGCARAPKAFLKKRAKELAISPLSS